MTNSLTYYRKLSPPEMNITFIVNSKSRKSAELVYEIHNLPLFRESKIRFTEHQGHAKEHAHQMAEWSDVIVAIGGDGTLNEVVNGIMSAGLDKDGRPKLGLLPLGSANDFARIQNISSNLEELVSLIESQKYHKVDVGKIQIQSENKIHYFINVMDSGIGAEVVQRLESKSIFRKILSSNLRFALAILRTFISYKRKKVKISIDDSTRIDGRILTLVVANSKAFGSGLIVAPDAQIDDGKFEILVGNISLFGYLLNVGRLLKGKKIKRKGVRYLQARKIHIEGPIDLYSLADGELAGSGNLEIACVTEAIKFLLP